MSQSVPRRGVRSALRRFLGSEAVGGLILIAAAALALLAANSGLADAYRHDLHAETGPVLSPKLGAMTVHLWINDGLIAVFFLLVGLEIKREFLDGSLSSWDRRRLRRARLPRPAGAGRGSQIGILIGSLLSAAAGYLALRFAPLHPRGDASRSDTEEPAANN